MTANRRRVTTRWIVGSLGWSALVSVLLLLVPTATSQTCTAVLDNGAECTTRHLSLLQSEGMSIVPILLVPVLIPVVALTIGRARRATLIGLGVVYLVLGAVAVLSIGAFYLPGAIALLLAGLMARDTTAVPGDR